MRNLCIAVFGLIALITAACGSAGTSTETTSDAPAGASTEVKISAEKSIPFEVKKAYADMRTDLTQVHIVLANYDLEMKPRTANTVKDVTSAEQVRVNIGLRGEKGDDFENPVQPGEYSGEKLGWVDIFHYADGRQQIVNLRDIDGKVTITEVTDTEIKGSVDASKDGKVVKASFTAIKLK